MINNYGYFSSKKKTGEDAEREFKAYLEGHGYDVIMTEGDFSDYDLKAVKGNIDITFEVKYNSGIEKYKTCFVEYFQSNKPAGMQKTKADWQIHFSEFGEIRGIRTNDLKKYIEDNELPLKSTMMKTKSGKISGQGYRVPFDVLTLIRGIEG